MASAPRSALNVTHTHTSSTYPSTQSLPQWSVPRPNLHLHPSVHLHPHADRLNTVAHIFDRLGAVHLTRVPASAGELHTRATN